MHADHEGERYDNGITNIDIGYPGHILVSVGTKDHCAV
jgi:hypothetical protein